MSESDATSAPIVFEPGARWKTVAIGPVFCAAVLVSEVVMGLKVHWLVLIVLALILAGFTAVQVGAARTHTSVLLTEQSLRQGTEILAVEKIRKIFPDPDEGDAADHEEYLWQSARALGELTGVPRGRKGIGLKIADGTLVQAWAKRPEVLRSALEGLVTKK